MKALRFKAIFEKGSTHHVEVVVHRTKKAMFRALHYKMSAKCLACCRDVPFPGTKGCVAELHFRLDELNLNAVVHECTHAAHNRTALMGFEPGLAREEAICTRVGDLVEVVVGHIIAKMSRLQLEGQYDNQNVSLFARYTKP